jgi:DNA gyrase inhibitor GyrI
MTVEIIEQAPLRAYVRQHHGPVATIPETWRQLWGWVVQNGLVKQALHPLASASAIRRRPEAFAIMPDLCFRVA